MLSRRALLTGGVLTGAVAGPGATPGLAASQSSHGSSNADEQVAKALAAIEDQLRGANGGNCPELTTIRSLQREFLKGHGKFPDFIEIGIDVWESVMNWHVRTRQQPQVTRSADGRYTLPLFQTNLVLRHDVSSSYIGQPFDAR